MSPGWRCSPRATSAIHTFPEHGFAALNLYSCRTRPRPDFAALVERHLGARGCEVRELPRGVKA